MNDDQKIDQNKNIASGVSVQGQPQVQSVGSLNKEHGPAASLSEIIKRSETQPQVTQELEEIGVEAKSDTVNLTPEHTQAGLQHAGGSMPVSTTSGSIANVPQTPKQIKKNIKKTKSTDSLRGLLLEILKNIQRMGFGQ